MDNTTLELTSSYGPFTADHTGLTVSFQRWNYRSEENEVHSVNFTWQEILNDGHPSEKGLAALANERWNEARAQAIEDGRREQKRQEKAAKAVRLKAVAETKVKSEELERAELAHLKAKYGE